jgi:riboflavin synthase
VPYYKGMFTGIIRHVGAVKSVAGTAAGKRLVIDAGPLAAGIGLGDSVAVMGVCLTASAIAGPLVTFDVVPQTLATTTLGALTGGSRVNLEPALRASQALDGHLVQGHGDGVATVARIVRGHEWRVTFAAARELTGMMVAKGSVAVDGVSLTLADVTADDFSVALIPTTLHETTLAAMAVGDKVNIETDVIGKYVLKFLGSTTGVSPVAGVGGAAQGTGKMPVLHAQPPAEGLTLDKLRDAGYLE